MYTRIDLSNGIRLVDRNGEVALSKGQLSAVANSDGLKRAIEVQTKRTMDEPVQFYRTRAGVDYIDTGEEMDWATFDSQFNETRT